MIPRHQTRIHLFVLALCVTACLAVGLYPRAVVPNQSLQSMRAIVEAAIARILPVRNPSSTWR